MTWNSAVAETVVPGCLFLTGCDAAMQQRVRDQLRAHFLCIGAETRNEGGFWAEKSGFVGESEDFWAEALERKVSGCNRRRCVRADGKLAAGRWQRHLPSQNPRIPVHWRR